MAAAPANHEVLAAYQDLRRLARAYLSGERPNHTLQPTALVHDALLQLLQLKGLQIQSNEHFFRLAARRMRLLLVDYGRRRRAWKRQVICIDQQSDAKLDEVVLVNDLLDDLSALDPRSADVMELTYFSGLNDTEVGKLLGISVSTVRSDREFARTWMFERCSANGKGLKELSNGAAA
ncbi:MAG: ECF-type sigma factor [Acidobacteria bacterium]|nr:ECF-type sigma factor [Acidobacteriota bacterium]